MPFYIPHFVKHYLAENEKLHLTVYDFKESQNKRLEALQEIINLSNIGLSWESYLEKNAPTLNDENTLLLKNEGMKDSKAPNDEVDTEEKLDLDVVLTALERVANHFILDAKLDNSAKSLASLCLAANVIHFLPGNGTPLSHPYMQRSLYWHEVLLNNPSNRPLDRVFAAEWLVDRYFRRLPVDAEMDHEYAQKALSYANKILNDPAIHPSLKKGLAARIAIQYENRIKKESLEDKHFSHAQESQKILVGSLKSEEELAEIIEDLNGKDFYGLDTDHIEKVDALFKDGFIFEAFQQIKLIHPEFNFNAESKTEEMPASCPTHNDHKTLLQIGFWKTNKHGFEILKQELCDDSEHLCWSKSMDDLLKLVDQGNSEARIVLNEVVDYHLNAALKTIPEIAAALKDKKIDEREMEQNISHYQYGSNGWIPLEKKYKDLGCSHLRELYYLARSGSTKSVFRHKGFEVAKEAMEQFYQKLAEECNKHKIENEFQKKSEFYSGCLKTQAHSEVERYKLVDTLNAEVFKLTFN